MKTYYPYESLGSADYGWLKTKYHFSFADYRNPDRMGFGALRVINDDRVKGGHGFDTHPHRNMEIITFVRSGAISHEDSHGHKGRTTAGDLQVMSAGSGIAHSEFNHESEDTTLFQIWIYPKENGITPRWDAGEFSGRTVTDHLPLLVSGRAEDKNKGALYIHQNASISGGQMNAGQEVTYKIHDQAYIVISKGDVNIDGQEMKQGDGLEVTDQTDLHIRAFSDAEIIVIDVPA